MEVLLQGLVVELLECFPVVEILAQGVGLGGVLVEDSQIELIRPLVFVCRTRTAEFCMGSVYDRALGFCFHIRGHVYSPFITALNETELNG